MVSLWPWKRDDSSAASFEKALSKLSEQITQSNVRLDNSRTRIRRVKALWTLYTSIAYLVFTLILTLVLGPQNWNAAHYGGIVGAPVVIYGVRKAANLFYNWRISSEQAYLDDLQKQRDTTIERLKAATKYNSTQELLDKYGGSSAKSTPSRKSPSGGVQKKKGTPTSEARRQPSSGRTGIPPPPTANIPGRSPQHGQAPSPPGRPSSAQRSASPAAIPFSPDEPGFAPNAFPSSSQPYPQSAQFHQESHWYDRILDVLLGEDETLPKNRLALVCTKCRLVNGQAPPGVKGLDDVGPWRCGGCGALNGEESAAKQVLNAIKQKEDRDRKEGWEVVSRGDESKEEDDRITTPSEKSSRKQSRKVIPSSDGEDDENEPGQNETDLDSAEEARSGKRVTRSANKENDLVEL